MLDGRSLDGPAVIAALRKIAKPIDALSLSDAAIVVGALLSDGARVMPEIPPGRVAVVTREDSGLSTAIFHSKVEMLIFCKAHGLAKIEGNA